MKWLQDPKQNNVENPNIARREASRCFRSNKKEYVKSTIDEFETKRQNQILETCLGASVTLSSVPSLELIEQGIKNGDLVTESREILVRGRNHFSQLLNIHRFNEFRHTEIYTSEPLVAKPSASEFQMFTEQLRNTQNPRY
jgi:hypothetical protein